MLRAFFFIAVLSLATVALLNVALFLAKVAAYERALAYVPAGYQSGLAQLETSLARDVQNKYPQQGLPYNAVAPVPAVCISNDRPCTYYASSTIVIPSQSAPAATQSCDASQTNCAQNMQEHPAVTEGRAAAQITTSILDRDRVPIVTRTKFVTLRTFGVDPYVALIGERDGAIGNRSAAPEGENAGLPTTQIVVKYHNTQDGSETERDRWSTQGWSSGNGSTGTWSP